MRIWILLCLAWLSYRDIKTRRLPAPALGVFLGLGVLVLGMRIWKGGFLHMVSLGSGIGLGVVSMLTGGALGMGDALVVLGLGCYLSEESMMYTLGFGFMLSMVWAMVLFWKKKNGKQEFPFVPFLLAGYLGGMCI